MKKGFLAKKLISWYEKNKRDLPWRNTKDAYKIWLSEVILQQTRVNQGLPYFQKFVESYPNVSALAQAPEREVLRLWQGLGYYSRAKNLHACANIIEDEYEGKFPRQSHELLKLRGVGKYTAAAIASFAFNEKVPVLDGNVYRVLSRIFGIKSDIATGKGQKNFFELATKHIPDTCPGIYNQAIMEFGALHCTPKHPQCDSCPFSNECYANSFSMQHSLPVKRKKLSITNRYFHYFIISVGGKIMMNERKEKDIWQGLFDFYLIEDNTLKDTAAIASDAFIEILKNNDGVLWHESRSFKHILTHQHIHARFFHVKTSNEALLNHIIKKRNIGLYSLNEIRGLPKPILIDNYLKEEIF